MLRQRMHRVRSRLGKWAWGLAAVSLAVTASVPARASLTARFDSEVSEVQRHEATDLIWGNGGKGPYKLSQRPIVPGTVSVRLNGAYELLPADYHVDYAAGTITFTTALSKDHIARVAYTYRPGGTGAGMEVASGPLSLNLAELQMGAGINSTVKLVGAWRATNSSQAPLTAIGVGLDTRVGSRTRVSSLIAVTPRSAQDGAGGDATGMQIAAETETKRAKARASYLRTGEAFAGAKDYRWQQGIEKLDLSGTYALTSRLSAQTAYQRTEEAADGQTARVKTLLSNALTADITPLSRLTLRRQEEEVSAPGDSESTKITERVQLDQRIGKMGTAQVHHEVMVDGSGSEEQTTQTTGMKLDARVTNSTRVVAQRLETRAEDQEPAIQTQVALSAGISGGKIKFEGEYLEHERPGLAAEEIQGARVEATPLGGVKIGGGVRQLQTGEQVQLQKHAQIEVRAPAGILLAGRLQEQTDGTGNMLGLVRAVDATMKPLQGIEMSGTYKEREERDQRGPFTRSLRIRLAPVKFLQLTGGLIQNPEEQGVVLQERRRTMGLRSELGWFTFTGDLAQRYDGSARPLAEELRLGMTLNLSAYDRLFTTYKVAEETGATALTTVHYGIGYSRRVANALDLSLESELLERLDENRTEEDEVRARASLNMRF